MKSGLELYLLDQFSLSGQIFFCIGQQQHWRGSFNFKIRNSRPFSPSYKSTYKMRSSWCVYYAQFWLITLAWLSPDKKLVNVNPTSAMVNGILCSVPNVWFKSLTNFCCCQKQDLPFNSYVNDIHDRRELAFLLKVTVDTI